MNGFRVASSCAFFLIAGWLGAEPVVPSFTHLQAGKASIGEQGQALIKELNCVACHEGQMGAGHSTPKMAPNLANAGERLTPQFLRAYLNDPHAVKPGTTMPTIFHASAPQAKSGAIDALTHFLVSMGGPIKPSRMSGSKSDVDAGKELFHTIGCVACHAPEGKEAEFPSIPLGNLAKKTTVDQLIAFLKNPKHARPSGRMPNFRLTDGQAQQLSVYLLRAQLDNPQNKSAVPAAQAGVAYQYFAGKSYVNKEAQLEKAKPNATGITPNFSIKIKGLKQNKSDIAFMFDSDIKIEKPGKYEFFTTSDDSSFLWIDGKKIVSNPGAHGMKEQKGAVTLTAGLHKIRVVFCQGGGGLGLEVRWKAPGGKKQAIPNHLLSSSGAVPMIPLESEPFVVNPQKVKMGKMMFSAMRCVSCHEVPGVSPSPRPAPSLAALAGKSNTGCLATTVPKGKPNYDLSADQRTALAAALKDLDALKKPVSESKQIDQRVAAFNCLACHSRNDVGGPGARDDYFKLAIEAELGDEGRIPPTLTGVGSKLKPEVLKQIVMEGKHHVRPYMATRMPSFDHSEVLELTALLTKVDGKPDDAKAPTFSKQSIQDGKKLVGITGFGCVNCHNLAGNKSLGVPAVDLATVSERLNPGWFSRFLDEPAAFNKATRMPGFWANGMVAFKDVSGGSAAAQQAGIWNYLSLGATMPLPKGIGGGTKGNELIPGGEPILLRTFVEHAGPRGIAIGFPERIHVSFDANLVRMTNAWKGKFFDPFGAWSGRNMKFNGPLGENVLNMPPGPSFAALASPETPWPNPDPKTHREVGRFKGYKYDAERVPILTYAQDGLSIEEQAKPELTQNGVILIRSFKITGESVPSGYHCIVAAGKDIKPAGKGKWTVDGTTTVTVAAPGMVPTVRSGKEGKELLVPISLLNKQATIEVQLQW